MDVVVTRISRIYENDWNLWAGPNVYVHTRAHCTPLLHKCGAESDDSEMTALHKCSKCSQLLTTPSLFLCSHVTSCERFSKLFVVCSICSSASGVVPRQDAAVAEARRRASLWTVSVGCASSSASRAHTGIWVRWGAQLGDYSPLVVARSSGTSPRPRPPPTLLPLPPVLLPLPPVLSCQRRCCWGPPSSVLGWF